MRSLQQWNNGLFMAWERCHLDSNMETPSWSQHGVTRSLHMAWECFQLDSNTETLSWSWPVTVTLQQWLIQPTNMSWECFQLDFNTETLSLSEPVMGPLKQCLISLQRCLESAFNLTQTWKLVNLWSQPVTVLFNNGTLLKQWTAQGLQIRS